MENRKNKIDESGEEEMRRKGEKGGLKCIAANSGRTRRAIKRKTLAQ